MSGSVATLCHMSTRDLADPAEIGRRILAAREALRLNQQEFADKAGLSRAYISRLERGLIPNPTITDLAQVAEAAGLPISTLMLRERAHRELVIPLGADVYEALANEPPELQASIIHAWRAASTQRSSRRRPAGGGWPQTSQTS